MMSIPVSSPRGWLCPLSPGASGFAVGGPFGCCLFGVHKTLSGRMAAFGLHMMR